MDYRRVIEGVSRKPWMVPCALALLGAVFLYSGIARYKKRLGYNMEMRSVLVSARGMPEGYVIRLRDLETANLPSKYLPVGVLFESDAVKVAGRLVTRPIAKGEMVLWSAIDVDFSSEGPARKIAKGYRAVSIQVDPVTSVGQAVQPGDRVDLVSTVTLPGESQPSTVALLQDVAVLDVGSAAGGEERNYSTVSLMVPPKDVGVIVHGERYGKLTLVLRNPGDHQVSRDLPVVSMEHLAETALRNSTRERNGGVEIIRGIPRGSGTFP